MIGNDSGNAMTEIALALAMAFFAIMILTMVSMGSQASAPLQTNVKIPDDDLHLVPSSPEEQEQTVKGDANNTRTVERRQLIIFSAGRFLDENLQPFKPGKLAAMKQPVLAVAPDLSMVEVMAAKSRLALPNLIITTLTQRWLDAIEEHGK